MKEDIVEYKSAAEKMAVVVTAKFVIGVAFAVAANNYVVPVAPSSGSFFPSGVPCRLLLLAAIAEDVDATGGGATCCHPIPLFACCDKTISRFHRMKLLSWIRLAVNHITSRIISQRTPFAEEMSATVPT